MSHETAKIVLLKRTGRVIQRLIYNTFRCDLPQLLFWNLSYCFYQEPF